MRVLQLQERLEEQPEDACEDAHAELDDVQAARGGDEEAQAGRGQSGGVVIDAQNDLSLKMMISKEYFFHDNVRAFKH